MHKFRILILVLMTVLSFRSFAATIPSDATVTKVHRVLFNSKTGTFILDVHSTFRTTRPGSFSGLDTASKRTFLYGNLQLGFFELNLTRQIPGEDTGKPPVLDKSFVSEFNNAPSTDEDDLSASQSGLMEFEARGLDTKAVLTVNGKALVYRHTGYDFPIGLTDVHLLANRQKIIRGYKLMGRNGATGQTLFITLPITRSWARSRFEDQVRIFIVDYNSRSAQEVEISDDYSDFEQIGGGGFIHRWQNRFFVKNLWGIPFEDRDVAIDIRHAQMTIQTELPVIDASPVRILRESVLNMIRVNQIAPDDLVWKLLPNMTASIPSPLDLVRVGELSVISELQFQPANAECVYVLDRSVDSQREKLLLPGQKMKYNFANKAVLLPKTVWSLDR